MTLSVWNEAGHLLRVNGDAPWTPKMWLPQRTRCCCALILLFVFGSLFFFTSLDLGERQFLQNFPLPETRARTNASRDSALSPVILHTQLVELSEDIASGTEHRDSKDINTTKLINQRLLKHLRSCQSRQEYLVKHGHVETLSKIQHTPRKSPPPWIPLTENSTESFRKFEVALDLPVPDTYNPNLTSPCWFGRGEKKYTGLLCLPSFFLAGFPKCGTTDLFYRLRLHPQVMTTHWKEPHWWTRNRFHGISFQRYLHGFSTATTCLSGMMSNLPSKTLRIMTGEGSASTFWDNHLWRKLPGNENQTEPRILNAHHIKHYLPDAKILVIVRNPITRMFSDYLYFWTPKKNNESSEPSAEEFHDSMQQAVEMFVDCLRSNSIRSCAYDRTNDVKVRLRIGLYAVFLKDWLTIFPRDQIHVIRTEDYQSEPRKELSSIYQFLGIDDMPEEVLDTMVASPKKNKGKRRLEMFNKTRDMLQELFEPFNRQLADILKDDRFLWRSES